MGLVNEAKDFIEEYRQRYLGDRQKFSNNLKLFAEKSEAWATRAAYQPYKWLFILPLLILSTFVCGSLAFFTSILFSERKGGFFAARWARINSFFAPMTVNVVGYENMASETSYVICANHQSLYDIYVLYGWLGVDFKWVMKKELEKVPVLGAACKALGHIFIDRSDSKSAIDTINAAKAKIVDGTSVVFFPEGSRSSDGVIRPFKKGAFRMAIDLGLPILPVTIIGTRKVLPKGSLDLRPGNVTLMIHPPICVKGYSEENLALLMDKTKMIISAPLD